MTTYSKINIIYRLQKWMDSVPGQTFLNYAYSWGASIVILGTLFKLTHLPGANFFLFLGMGTEVFVFFLSAFDRPFDKTTEGMELDVHAGAASGEQVGHAGGSTVIIGGGAPASGGSVPASGVSAPVSSDSAPVVSGGAPVGGGTVIIGGGAPASAFRLVAVLLSLIVRLLLLFHLRLFLYRVEALFQVVALLPPLLCRR